VFGATQCPALGRKNFSGHNVRDNERAWPSRHCFFRRWLQFLSEFAVLRKNNRAATRREKNCHSKPSELQRHLNNKT
jgi:hypothetical protein